MDAFINRRLADGRYRLRVSSRNQPSTAVSSWYESSDFAALSGGVVSGNAATSVVLVSDAPTRHVAAVEKKPYTEAKKRALENRDTSDGSDGGVCWSEYSLARIAQIRSFLTYIQLHTHDTVSYLQVTTSASPARPRVPRAHVAQRRRRTRRRTAMRHQRRSQRNDSATRTQRVHSTYTTRTVAQV